MKFLHTGDWQIGMRAAHVGAAAQAVRDERLAAARRVVDAAAAHGCEFLVLAGDTFEDNAVDRTLVQRIADILARSPCPVFVLPGNHDPLVAGSVWDHLAWASLANVTVLREASSIPVAGGTLWPCPLRAKIGRADPTAWIAAAGPRDATQGIRVGIAHGTVEGVDADGHYFPIPRDAAERAGLDYLAIGHWHSTGNVGDRLAYSGTHEPTKFGERDSGNALVVEIDAPGAVPRLTTLRTGRLEWVQWNESCTDEGALARVVERLDKLNRAEATLLDVTLSGVLQPSDELHLARLRELAASRLLHHRIDATGLRPAPDDAWLATLPAGAVRDAAQRLRAWTVSAVDRPEGVTDRVAARALLELYAIQSASAGGKR